MKNCNNKQSILMNDKEFQQLILPYLNDYKSIKPICKQHPVETMENLFVEPKLGKRIKLNPAQKRVINLILNSKDVFALGSRQIAGKSTIALYMATYLATFYDHYYVYYISLEASRQCAEFIQNVERVLDAFPFKINHKRTTMNNAQIVLENGSMIMTAAVARKKEFSSIAKSRTAHFIIIDEFSDIKGNMELLSAISATMAATRKLSVETKLPTSILLISNAFEISEPHHQYTYNLWMNSVADKTNYNPVLFYYRALMSEEEANRFIEQERKRGIPMKQILVNYECYFTRSESSFIDDDELLQRIYSAKRSYILFPISGVHRDYNIKIYDINKLNDISIIAVDTATRYGSDYYAFVGITRDGELILEFNDKLSAEEAIELIKKLDDLCPNSLIAIERNMGSHIIELVENNVKLFYEDNKPGFYTNDKKKKNMFVILKEFLYKNAEKLYSESILRQLLTLKSYRNSFKSDTHDDLAMAYAIAVYINELERLKEDEIPNETKIEQIDKVGMVTYLDTKNINQLNNTLEQLNNNYVTDNLLFSNSPNPFATIDMFLKDFGKK